MKDSKKYLIIRGFGYILGFILFYAPFALFQKFLIRVLKLSGSEDIHGSCFRMGIQGLLTGKGINILTTSGIIIILILVLSFLLGPVFCGRFCVIGATSEFLSRIIPKKIQINWQKIINPTPVRYGVLAGFLISPLLGVSVLCSYCNYSLFEKLVLGGIDWNIMVFSSANILLAFVWLILLGAFATGGRGFCSYLCPVGATQSLIHFIGSKFKFTYKIKYDSKKCISCNLCIKDCPMGALQSEDNNLSYSIHDCITCNQCVHTCHKKAITFGRGISGWKEQNNQSEKEEK